MKRCGGSVVLSGAVVLLAFLEGSTRAAAQGAPAPSREKPAPSREKPPPSREKIEELAALGRLWGEIKFVHPWLHSRDIDWDAALLAVLPQAIEARGPEQFRAAVAELLAVLDDPATRVLSSTAPTTAIEASHAVASTTDPASKAARSSRLAA